MKSNDKVAAVLLGIAAGLFAIDYVLWRRSNRDAREYLEFKRAEIRDALRDARNMG